MIISETFITIYNYNDTEMIFVLKILNYHLYIYITMVIPVKLVKIMAIQELLNIYISDVYIYICIYIINDSITFYY